MVTALRDQLRQRKPFSSLEQEAQLDIVRASSMLRDEFEQPLKPHAITGTQYNVLRILRGAEPDGLCRNELRDRLLTRMPDVTRLLDRLEEAGLVTRARQAADRPRSPHARAALHPHRTPHAGATAAVSSSVRA